LSHSPDGDKVSFFINETRKVGFIRDAQWQQIVTISVKQNYGKGIDAREVKENLTKTI
jgi:hypothetical protein